jgi:hypothetical protein
MMRFVIQAQRPRGHVQSPFSIRESRPGWSDSAGSIELSKIGINNKFDRKFKKRYNNHRQKLHKAAFNPSSRRMSELVSRALTQCHHHQGKLENYIKLKDCKVRFPWLSPVSG